MSGDSAIYVLRPLGGAIGLIAAVRFHRCLASSNIVLDGDMEFERLGVGVILVVIKILILCFPAFRHLDATVILVAADDLQFARGDVVLVSGQPLLDMQALLD